MFQPAAVSVLPADEKNTKELKLTETEVIELFRNDNYKICMFVGITSNM